MNNTTTKVIFNLPITVKHAAARRAKAEGMTLSTVLQRSAAAYGAGELTIRATEKLKPSVRKSIARAIEDYKRGINMSPAFDNVEDAHAYLRKEMARMRKHTRK
jgi:hypothetical protein